MYFTKRSANIRQVLFDGNGSNDNGTITCEYTLDDNTITVTTENGEILDISYQVENGILILGDGSYFTDDDVIDGLQGYWTHTETTFGLKYETNLLIDGDSYTVEQANEGFGLSAGEYYYSGPHIGYYTVGVGTLDFGSTLGQCYGWGFNIIDGEVIPIQYNHVCFRGDSLPGQYGYTF